MMQGMYDTITVWNKHYDLTSKQTTYYRHVLDRCNWDVDMVRTVNDSTVSLANTWRVTIEARDGYLPYADWLQSNDKSNHFTANEGDLVAKGEHADEITPANMTAVMSALKSDVFAVKVVDDNTQEWKYGRHIAIEGV